MTSSPTASLRSPAAARAHPSRPAPPRRGGRVVAARRQLADDGLSSCRRSARHGAAARSRDQPGGVRRSRVPARHADRSADHHAAGASTRSPAIATPTGSSAASSCGPGHPHGDPPAGRRLAALRPRHSGLMGAPSEVLGAARTGLLVMTPWTWSIAYRRYQQGVLIRSGRSRLVGIGTAVRLAAIAVVSPWAAFPGASPGSWWARRPSRPGSSRKRPSWASVVRPAIAALPDLDEDAPPLTRRRFVRFYAPARAHLRPDARRESACERGDGSHARDARLVGGVAGGQRAHVHAAQPGLRVPRGRGRDARPPRGRAALRRFAPHPRLATSGGLAIVAATPLAERWFRDVSALSVPLAELAQSALWVGVPLPAMAARSACSRARS